MVASRASRRICLLLLFLALTGELALAAPTGGGRGADDSTTLFANVTRVPRTPQLERLAGDSLALLRTPSPRRAGYIERLNAARFIKSAQRTAGDFRYAYGRDAYRAWCDGDAHLNAIPRGELGRWLTVEGILRLNQLTYVASDEDRTSRLTNWLRRLQGHPIQAGHLRDYQSFSQLIGPVSPADQATLQHLGCALVKVPFAGGRRVIRFPHAAELPAALEQLVRETRAALEDRSSDVVTVAARFAHRFLVLHPLPNGNGRVAKLLLDRILGERGLPPPILSKEMVIDPEAFRAEVAVGVYRMIRSVHAASTRRGRRCRGR